MAKLFFNIGITLDGFIAGPNGGPKNPLGDGGTRMHEWLFKQRAFLEGLHLPGGEITEPDNSVIAGMITRPGANVMGKRMFEEGEFNWPEDAPFHTPVFVVTKERRAPWVRQGGTTFHFVNDGLESALSQAKKAAGGKDVRISGGADMIRQCLNAGVVDDFTLHVAPILLGNGTRLFGGVDGNLKFELTNTVSSPLVSHLSYRINRT